MNPKEIADSTIRVVVVNESGFIREGLCRIIERFKDVKVVASIPDPHELFGVAQQERADIALIDAQLPSQAGFEATQKLRKSGVITRAVFLSVNPSLAEVNRALQAGANGFLLREAGVDELEMALHDAAKDKIFLCPTIIKRLSDKLSLEELPNDEGFFIDAAQESFSIDDIISEALRLGILKQGK